MPEDVPRPLSSASQDTITKVEYFRIPPRWIFVRVETSGGYVGWGEATLEGHQEAVEGALAQLSRMVSAKSSDDVQSLQLTKVFVE